jgi:hypothetical protein
MDIAQEVSQRSGLPPDQARIATQAVLGVLNEKLPEPAKSMVAQLASGGGDIGSQAQGFGGETGQGIDQAAQQQQGGILDSAKNVISGGRGQNQ